MVRGSPSETGIQSAPDGSTLVESVNQSNNRQFQTRGELQPGQKRVTFNITAIQNGAFLSSYVNVVNPIPSGGSENLYIGETGTQMPYQPNSDRNLIITQISTSARSPCQLTFSVDNDVFNTAFIGAGTQVRDQVSALPELQELVDVLDGSHTVTYELENLDDQYDLEAQISIRAIVEGI